MSKNKRPKALHPKQLYRRCATRIFKNIRHLQKEVPDVLSGAGVNEWLRHIPQDVLERLHTPGKKDLAGVKPKIAKRLKEVAFPFAALTPTGPLFQNTLYFAQIEFTVVNDNGATVGVHVVSDADIEMAIKYATLASVPISTYASAYGKNSIAVSEEVCKLRVKVQLESGYTTDGKYSDSDLQGWIKQIRQDNDLPDGSCVVVLNPDGGVHNLGAVHADGYHFESLGGPYIWAQVWSKGLTLADPHNAYSETLSHEIAEMVVDPTVDPKAPEVCDGCSGSCGKSYVNYFNQYGSYITTVKHEGVFPPPPAFDYEFYIAAIILPEFATLNKGCPADQEPACEYGGPPHPLVRPIIQPEITAAWLVQKWLVMHSPDPGPPIAFGQEQTLVESLKLAATVSAIAGLARCLNDLTAEKTILGALRSMPDKVARELHEALKDS